MDKGQTHCNIKKTVSESKRSTGEYQQGMGHPPQNMNFLFSPIFKGQRNLLAKRATCKPLSRFLTEPAEGSTHGTERVRIFYFILKVV